MILVQVYIAKEYNDTNIILETEDTVYRIRSECEVHLKHSRNAVIFVLTVRLRGCLTDCMHLAGDLSWYSQGRN